jgi:hypothetical protein
LVVLPIGWSEVDDTPRQGRHAPHELGRRTDQLDPRVDPGARDGEVFDEASQAGALGEDVEQLSVLRQPAGQRLGVLL